MNELILKGYARESASVLDTGKYWYYLIVGSTTQTNEKIGVVLYLSAEFHGTSINKALLRGIDLTNQIVRVMLQFSEEQIAVTGDIETMYH